jgi:hypothetical protein
LRLPLAAGSIALRVWGSPATTNNNNANATSAQGARLSFTDTTGAAASRRGETDQWMETADDLATGL